MKNENIYLVSRREYASHVALEIEDEIKRNNTSVHDAVVKSLSNYKYSKVIFPFNTENEVYPWRLEAISRNNQIPKSISTKLMSTLNMMSEYLTKGTPTDEVAIYIYNEVQKRNRNDYVFRNFGEKQYRLLELYLKDKKLIR